MNIDQYNKTIDNIELLTNKLNKMIIKMEKLQTELYFQQNKITPLMRKAAVLKTKRISKITTGVAYETNSRCPVCLKRDKRTLIECVKEKNYYSTCGKHVWSGSVMFKEPPKADESDYYASFDYDEEDWNKVLVPLNDLGIE